MSYSGVLSKDLVKRIEKRVDSWSSDIYSDTRKDKNIPYGLKGDQSGRTVTYTYNPCGRIWSSTETGTKAAFVSSDLKTNSKADAKVDSKADAKVDSKADSATSDVSTVTVTEKSQKENESKESNETVSLGDRMKKYENETPAVVSKDAYLVIRADGHHFSKVTASFQKPADERITRAMTATMVDMLKEFDAVTAYTFSDEISLVMRPCTAPDHTRANGGRVQKLASRVAGYCSVRFMHHLSKEKYPEPNLLELVNSGNIYFDARCIAFPTKEEVANHFVWRSIYDCVRNAVAALARRHLGPKACINKNSPEMKQMLVEEKARRFIKSAATVAPAEESKEKKVVDLATAITWDDQTSHYKWGSYVKREQRYVDAIDQHTNKPIRVQRTHTCIRSFPILCNEYGVSVLFAKYWIDEDSFPTLCHC